MSIEDDPILKAIEAATKGAMPGLQSWFLGMVDYPKKKYYMWKFGPKAKSKRGFRLGRITEDESDKVYIVDDKAKKYYWIKTRKIRDGLGYAGSDTNREEISRTEIEDYDVGNPIYWNH